MSLENNCHAPKRGLGHSQGFSMAYNCTIRLWTEHRASTQKQCQSRLQRSRAAKTSASGRYIMPAAGAAQSSCPRSASNSSGAGGRREPLGDPNGRRQSSSMPRGRGRRCCSVPTCMCLTCPPASKEPHQKRSSSRGSAESDDRGPANRHMEMTRVFSQCVWFFHGESQRRDTSTRRDADARRFDATHDKRNETPRTPHGKRIRLT